MKRVFRAGAAAASIALWAVTPSLAAERLASPGAAEMTPREMAMEFARDVCLAPGGTVPAMVAAGEARGVRFDDMDPPKVDGMEIRRITGASWGEDNAPRFRLTLVDAVLLTPAGKVRWSQCNLTFGPGDEAATAKVLEPMFGPASGVSRRGGHGWAFRVKDGTRTPVDFAPVEIPKDAGPVLLASPERGSLMTVSTSQDKDEVDFFIVIFAPL